MSLAVFLLDLDAALNGEETPCPTPGEQVTLSGPEGRHAVSVKRIQPGERIELATGNGHKAVAEVLEVRGKDTLVARVEEVNAEPPRPRVTVIQALPKSERSELTVDLLTQGGAEEIVAWQASRCVARWSGPKAAKGVQKWRQAAVAAAKQSRRARVPQVTGPLGTDEALQVAAGADLCLMLHEEASISMGEIDLSGADRADAQIVLVIGPEGGISEEEAARFAAVGAQPVKLGPEVLRTASAGLVALAAIGVRTSRWQ